LVALGYDDHLPAPAPVVQATLAMIIEPEIYRFIQETDKAALHDVDDEGEHAQLLLITLDLSHWTSIMIACITDMEKGLGRLRKAH
jgi:hypothetical protein